MKVFLDTNVMLDFLGERKLFFKPAEIIVNLADIGELTICVSALSFATCNYFLGKEFGLAIAKEKISKFKIISEIVALDEIIIEKSLTSNFSDFEDGLQYFSALKTNCKHIITRDLKDFKSADISSLTPTEFLTSFQKS
jgi:predicted nucleic acid-binding protein